MKPWRIVVLVLLAVAIVIGVVLITRQSLETSAPPKPTPQPSPVKLISPVHSASVSKSPAPPVVAAPAAPRFTAPGGQQIRADQVIAAVNGVSILGKDLMPFAGSKEGKEIDPQILDFLRNLAIERELVRQAARAQGITLTDTQKLQLEQVRKSLVQQEGSPADGVVHLNRDGSLADEIAFQLDDATCRLLQASLLEKAGAPSPVVTDAAVQQYYRDHASDFSPLPSDPAQRSAAWSQIDLRIRQQLALPTLQAYQTSSQEFMGQLKAKAVIAIN